METIAEHREPSKSLYVARGGGGGGGGGNKKEPTIKTSMKKSATFHDFCEEEEEGDMGMDRDVRALNPPDDDDEDDDSGEDACRSEPVTNGRSRRINRLETFTNWLQRFSLKRRHVTGQRALIRPSVSLCMWSLVFLCSSALLDAVRARRLEQLPQFPLPPRSPVVAFARVAAGPPLVAFHRD